MKGATSYEDTKLGILPRQKVVRLEIEGVIGFTLIGQVNIEKFK